jgi:hypothetical protein
MDNWIDVLSSQQTAFAKSFKVVNPSLSYADCVKEAKVRHPCGNGKGNGKGGNGGKGGKGGGKGDRKGKGGGKGGGPGPGKGGGKCIDSKKGKCIECPSEKCKGSAYSNHMARDAVTCHLCSTLYPREQLSPEQQKHWDGVARSRGVGETTPEEEEDLLEDDQDTAANEDGGLEPGEEKQSLKELQASLVRAEAELEQVRKITSLPPDSHGAMCNQLMGAVSRIKTRIEAAKSDEPPNAADAAWKLNKELQSLLVHSKAEKARLAKWETKAVELEKETKEARVHAQVCRENEADIQAQVLALTQQLAQLASGQPPPAEPMETAGDLQAAEAARHQEVQNYVAEALKQQRTEMLAEFHTMWVNAAAANPTAAASPGAAGGTAAASTEEAAPDPIKKMGDDFKKKSAGLAAKAATSVVKSHVKEKGRDKKKDEAKKKLTGEAAAAADESEALAARTVAQLKEVA